MNPLQYNYYNDNDEYYSQDFPKFSEKRCNNLFNSDYNDTNNFEEENILQVSIKNIFFEYDAKDIFDVKENNDNLFSDISLPQQQQSTNNITIKHFDSNNIDDNSNKSLLNKKRKSSKKEEKEQNQLKEKKAQKSKKNEHNSSSIKSRDTKRKIFGIKKERENKHDKYCEDNIACKIKGKIFPFIYDIIKNISKGIYDFKKFTNDFKSCLTKDINIKLFDDKLVDIINREEISTKYSTFDKDENKIIIKRIYENKEKNKLIINLLGLTFEEAIILFRKNLKNENDKIKIKKILQKLDGLDFSADKKEYKDINNFIKEIKEKNNNNEYEYNEYIEKVKELCCNYKNWFLKKIGRTSKKSY